MEQIEKRKDRRGNKDQSIRAGNLMLEILGKIKLRCKSIMDIRKFRSFDPKAKIVLTVVVTIVAYGIGGIVGLGLPLGGVACAGSYWAFFGFGGDC